MENKKVMLSSFITGTVLILTVGVLLRFILGYGGIFMNLFLQYRKH